MVSETLMPTDLRAEQAQTSFLSHEDRPWLEELGCAWPEVGQDEWLDSMNQIVEIGSEHLKTTKRIEGADSSRQLEIVAARELFFGYLTKISQKAINKLRTTSAPKLVPINTFIETQRVFRGSEISAAPIIEKYPYIINYGPELAKNKISGLESLSINVKTLATNPSIFSSSVETIESKLKNLEAAGLKDASKVVNACPTLLNLSIDSVQAKLRALYAPARKWGWPNYEEKVNGFVDQWPQILTYSSAKIRTLVRIATETLPPHTADIVEIKDIRSAVKENLEAVVVGYLLGSNEVYGPEDIHKLANLHKKAGKVALQRIIAKHTDDPVVRVYLRGYPLPQAA
jgi:hypothetical protein